MKSRRKQVWDNLVTLVVNEALDNGHLRFEKTDIVNNRGMRVTAPAFIDPATFEFKLARHVVRARLAPAFDNCEASIYIVVDPEPNTHKHAARLSSEPGGPSFSGWSVRPYKNCHVCSAVLAAFLEIEKGPYICPTVYGSSSIRLRNGWGDDIAAVRVRPRVHLSRAAK